MNTMAAYWAVSSDPARAVVLIVLILGLGVFCAAMTVWEWWEKRKWRKS
jgi:hypothetical protein